jgi:alkylation response protein AidB-like acyl-CoA dehydrogenase
MQPSVYERPEHAELRKTVARFLAEEVEPHGEAWEEQGFVPRPVIRKLGSLGLLGITYPPEYGGAGADNVTAVVFQEALSRSTFGGFVVTVLVHTDMASPHLVRAGSKAQLEKYLRKVIAGELVTAVAVTEPDAGSDVAAIRTRASKVKSGDGDSWVLNGTKMFMQRSTAILLSRRAPMPRTRARAASRCSSSRRARRAFASAARSASRVGSRRTPPSSYSRIAASLPEASSVPRTRASTPSCATSRPSASRSAPWRSGTARRR